MESNTDDPKTRDLMEHAVICSMQFVGRKLYDRATEVEIKYPELFPWETKYRSIPKEVHHAYREDMADYLQSLPSVFGDAPTGIIALSKWLQEQNEKERERTKDFTPKQHMDDLVNAMKAREEKDALDLKNRKRIWNKHYKTYKLPYADGY